MQTNQAKVILVTGASSGMGKDGALRLIADGHIVYGVARRRDRMQDIVEAGGHALEMDVTDAASISKAVAQVIADQGRIDVLWNNAGFSVTGAVEDVSSEDARRQFEVNLFGVAEITKAVLPQMRKQRSGLILNTSSVGGKIFTPLGAWYHASKHALEGWSDCLRLELAPFNINVVILEPGGVKSEFGDVMYEPLIARASGGAYEAMTKSVADSYSKNYAPSNTRLSDPSVVSDVVAKAVASRKPRTRYAVGYGSKTVLFMRWLLSDRLFGRMISSQF